jgi:23S rRNA pseudouridine1911/1915/1917 synthase
MDHREWTADPRDAGSRLDKFLAEEGRLGSRARAASAIERGKVYLNGTEAGIEHAGRRLAPGDKVSVWFDRPGSASVRKRAARIADLHVLYEDDVLLVVNKPAGLLAVPLESKDNASSVYLYLREHFRRRGRARPFVVHRIDRDTSGLVVFAKNPSAGELLKTQFKRREPERIYWAVVHGTPEPSRGTWRDRLAWDEKALRQKPTHPRDPLAKDAISEYRVLESFRRAALIEVRLRTGRQNQIRIQAGMHGHTLVGERKYVFGPDRVDTIAFERQALHARRLVFRHPVDGRRLEFEAPPPADFEALVQRLRRSG